MNSQRRSDEELNIAPILGHIAADLRQMLGQEIELAEVRLQGQWTSSLKSMGTFVMGLVLGTIGLVAGAVALQLGLEGLGSSRVFSYSVVAFLYIGAALCFILNRPHKK